MNGKYKVPRSGGPGPRAVANRKYKKKIYALCDQVRKGNKAAERKLEKEIKLNTLAQWAIKHWVRLQNSRARKVGMSPSKDGLPPSRAKGRKQPKYGNPFKPYQGGAPGLGKKR